MYYKHLKNLTLVILALVAFACASKKDEAHDDHDSDQKEWKEMDEFHMIMAETFHPFKDSANLEPAKARAGELAAAADKWVSATLPEKVDNDEMKNKLKDLKAESSALVQTVGDGDDKVIGDQLTKVHDLFHSIQEDWYGGNGGGHGHQH